MQVAVAEEVLLQLVPELLLVEVGQVALVELVLLVLQTQVVAVAEAGKQVEQFTLVLLAVLESWLSQYLLQTIQASIQELRLSQL
jgi:hypothetical protein